jgi:hypothetical protein
MKEEVQSKSVVRRLREQICYRCKHRIKPKDGLEGCKLDDLPRNCDHYEYDEEELKCHS